MINIKERKEKTEEINQEISFEKGIFLLYPNYQIGVGASHKYFASLLLGYVFCLTY